MRKNNKGFMLVEVIIVATVIVTALVALYHSFNQIYAKYNTRGKYYSIDAVYACRMFINYLLEDDAYEGNLNTFVSQIIERDIPYIFIIDDDSADGKKCTTDGSSLGVSSSFCSAMVEVYDVRNMIFLEYDEETVSSLKALKVGNSVKLDIGFQEYIDYMLGYYDIKSSNLRVTVNNEGYSYIVLVEIGSGDDSYYGSLRVR